MKIELIINYINFLSPLMAHVEVSKLSQQEVAELACTYAALILHDDEQDITGDKIGKLVTAAGVKIESYWPKIFAKALQGKDISSFFNFGGAASEAPATAPVAAKKDDKKDDKKHEEKGGKKQQKKKDTPAPPPPPPAQEEEEVDMGDLFG